MENVQPSYNVEDLDPVPPYSATLYPASPPSYEQASLPATQNGVPMLTAAQNVPAQPSMGAQVHHHSDGGPYARLCKAFKKMKEWMKRKVRV
ncbi:hypothetical protein B0H12DRAFT_1230045 [Mycena haematopus]|nr:hypothetical protein B0H12DRAFT_1230045 [Mycena haematopus]